jgi:tRNA synthetases class II core domain (F)
VYTQRATQEVEQMMKSKIESFVKYLLGSDLQYRWVDAYFPFTHPSFEMEILYNNEWIEILGCGVVEYKILENCQIKNMISYAAGFGLERLAMIKYKIPDLRLFWSKDTGFCSQFEGLLPNDDFTFKPFSVHPQCINDISFWLSPDHFWTLNDFFDLVREEGGDLIEQVKLIDDYTSKEGKQSKCFRIIYRSHERTLTKDEVNVIHRQIEEKASQLLKVTIR